MTLTHGSLSSEDGLGKAVDSKIYYTLAYDGSTARHIPLVQIRLFLDPSWRRTGLEWQHPQVFSCSNIIVYYFDSWLLLSLLYLALWTEILVCS